MSVLLTVTSTVAPLLEIVTMPSFGVPELSLKVTGPNDHPVGGVGGDSLTVHTVPSGIPLIVVEEPAETDAVPVWAASQAYPIVKGPVYPCGPPVNDFVSLSEPVSRTQLPASSSVFE